MNRHFDDDDPDDTELEARINAYELAYRMQAAGPEAVDLTKETEATKKLYGMDEDANWGRHELSVGEASRRARRALRGVVFRQRKRLGCAQRYRGQPFPDVQVFGQADRRTLGRFEIARPA